MTDLALWRHDFNTVDTGIQHIFLAEITEIVVAESQNIRGCLSGYRPLQQMFRCMLKLDGQGTHTVAGIGRFNPALVLKPCC